MYNTLQAKQIAKGRHGKCCEHYSITNRAKKNVIYSMKVSYDVQICFFTKNQCTKVPIEEWSACSLPIANAKQLTCKTITQFTQITQITQIRIAFNRCIFFGRARLFYSVLLSYTQFTQMHSFYIGLFQQRKRCSERMLDQGG